MEPITFTQVQGGRVVGRLADGTLVLPQDVEVIDLMTGEVPRLERGRLWIAAATERTLSALHEDVDRQGRRTLTRVNIAGFYEIRLRQR